MHPHAIEPSLRAAERAPDSLADGFSPPADAQAPEEEEHEESAPAGGALTPKSPF